MDTQTQLRLLVAIARESRFTNAESRVLAYLATFADCAVIHTSYRAIMDACGLGNADTLRRALNGLRDVSAITWTPGAWQKGKPTKAGEARANEYELQPTTVWKFEGREDRAGRGTKRAKLKRKADHEAYVRRQFSAPPEKT